MTPAYAPWSLRKQLTALSVVAIVAVGLIGAFVSMRLAHREADLLFDAQLRQAAETLKAWTSSSDINHLTGELAEHRLADTLPFEFEIHYRPSGGESRLLAATAGQPPFPNVEEGFSYHPYMGSPWRFLRISDPKNHFQISIGLSEKVHDEIEHRLILQLLLPVFLSVPLMALMIGLIVRRVLRPVDRLTREVGALDPNSLSPLTSVPLPAEIGPLRDAMNGMIRRVSGALDNERRFTDDAAHELRTPLAALKVQAQVAGRTADDVARKHALQQLTSGVDRMTHLVEQLLTLARVRPGQIVERAVDAVDIAAEVCAEYTPAADAAGQTLELEASSPCPLDLPAPWIASVVGNLVNNAIRYAGQGATIIVRLDSDAVGTMLRVEDNGVGVPLSERERLLARFARGDQAHEVSGCGLGLSIVARIAEVSRGTLRLIDGLPHDDGGVGLAVELFWRKY